MLANRWNNKHSNFVLLCWWLQIPLIAILRLVDVASQNVNERKIKVSETCGYWLADHPCDTLQNTDRSNLLHRSPSICINNNSLLINGYIIQRSWKRSTMKNMDEWKVGTICHSTKNNKMERRLQIMDIVNVRIILKIWLIANIILYVFDISEAYKMKTKTQSIPIRAICIYSVSFCLLLRYQKHSKRCKAMK